MKSQTHSFNPSTQEVKTRASPQVQDQPAERAPGHQGYTVKSLSKRKKKIHIVLKPGVAIHTCNPSDAGSRDRGSLRLGLLSASPVPGSGTDPVPGESERHSRIRDVFLWLPHLCVCHIALDTH